MERGPGTDRIASDPDERNDERSIKELIERLGEQTQALARKEVELAKAEMGLKAKRLGIGAGAFGGAGLIALLALGALTAAAIMGLAEAVDGWLAALIVAAAYGAVAGILALIGRSRVQAGTPPLPEETVESVKEDVEWAKTKAKQART
jgi:Putative Actinobacterial Holin-X, holin superfamily III